MQFLVSRFRFIIVGLLLGLAACANVTTPTPSLVIQDLTQEVTQDSPEAAPTLTASPPTEAPTEEPAPDYAVLVLPQEADQAAGQRLKDELQSLTNEQGWLLEVHLSLTSTDLAPNLKLVVAVAPFNNLPELTQSAPQVRFVGVAITGLPELPNLTVIGPLGWRNDQQSFLAGYIAALTSPDWRGGILTTNTPEGQAQQAAFTNGLRYFCGLCKPAYPPYFTYPRWAQISSGSDQATWTAAIDELVSEGVVTVYIDPVLATDELLAYVSQTDMQIIGAVPPSLAFSPSWVATITPEPEAALREYWQDILTGQSSQIYPMPLRLTDLTAGFLTTARQRLVQQTLDDLMDGFINPNLVIE